MMSQMNKQMFKQISFKQNYLSTPNRDFQHVRRISSAAWTGCAWTSMFTAMERTIVATEVTNRITAPEVSNFISIYSEILSLLQCILTYKIFAQ